MTIYLTSVDYKLNPERLYATYFGGDAAQGLEVDAEGDNSDDSDDDDDEEEEEDDDDDDNDDDDGDDDDDDDDDNWRHLLTKKTHCRC